MSPGIESYVRPSRICVTHIQYDASPISVYPLAPMLATSRICCTPAMGSSKGG